MSKMLNTKFEVLNMEKFKGFKLKQGDLKASRSSMNI